MYEQKYQTKKKIFKKHKSGSKEKNRNKINSGFVYTETNIVKKAKRQEGCSKRRICSHFLKYKTHWWNQPEFKE